MMNICPFLRILVLLTVLLFCTQPYAQKTELTEKFANPDLPEDLTQVGLKELLDMDLVVTSPGRKEQVLADVSSAIYVLSGEDIRRSGVTHIAEALRLVPGVNVARISASQWAVSIRGFNQVYSHRLLVLLDGVSVFSPLTNGVYWETLDLVMQDIERIEVIRGPGAALWGSNAVNGVVNIITKKASATNGGLLSIGGGSPERAQGTIRYGSKITDSIDARISGRVTHVGDNELMSGGNANDDWGIGSVNARVDSELGKNRKLTFLGNAFSEKDQVQTQTPILSPPYIDTTSYSGVGRWKGGYVGANYNQTFSDASKLNVVASSLYQERESKLISLDYIVNELDTTYNMKAGDHHDLLMGVSARIFSNSVDGSYAEDVIPNQRTMHRYNWFLQDDITLVPNKWHVIFGSKFEHNNSTGFEYMPTARTIWTPDEKNSVWASVSRAVAPPSLVFDDIQFPVASIPGQNGDPNTLVTIFGNRGVSSETVLAYELGYRSLLSEEVSIDTALFYNIYDNIFGQEPDAPYVGVPNRTDQTVVIVPLRFANGLKSRSFGGEFTVEYKPYKTWKLSASYSYLQSIVKQGTSLDTADASIVEGSAPRNAVVIRSSADLSEDVTFDVFGRYQQALRLNSVPSYFEVDSNIIWKLNSNVSLSLLGQNLIQSSHLEYLGNLFGPSPTAIRRTIMGGITCKF